MLKSYGREKDGDKGLALFFLSFRNLNIKKCAIAKH